MPLAATKPVYDAIRSAGADLGGVHNFGGYALNSFRLEKVSWCHWVVVRGDGCGHRSGVELTLPRCLSLLTLAGLPSAGL